MSDASVRTLDFPIQTGLVANDKLVALYSNSTSTNTVLVSLLNLFGNSAVDHQIQNGHVLIIPSNPPANSSANGQAGTLTWDSNNLYICVANATWGKVALTLSW